MPRSAAANGFTLIEILVVMVIVGLMATLAVVTMGGGSQQRELTGEVQDLYLRMQVAAEQAVLNNAEAGLVIEPERYQFVLFDEASQAWKPSPQRPFQARTVPPWLNMDPQVAADAPRLLSAKKTLRPDIVFFSSGETTPFVIDLWAGGQPGAMLQKQVQGGEQ